MPVSAASSATALSVASTVVPIATMTAINIRIKATERQDDATQRRRLRNVVKQSRQLPVILAHAALVAAYLGIRCRYYG